MTQSPKEKLTGLLLPVFTPRREGDLGIGDTKALVEMIDWAASCDIGFLQLLPINEMGADESPYSAISSAAIDPIYLTLDTDSLPWVPPELFSRARDQLESAIASPNVLYPTVRRGKRNVLEAAWKQFPEATEDFHRAFDAFVENEADWLKNYCTFKLLMEFFGNDVTWDQWPEQCRTPDTAREFVEEHRMADPQAVESRLGYFSFVQWLCYGQWEKVRDHASRQSVKLMGDIPIGISWHSCDVFFHQPEFHLGWFGGTPPEGGGSAFLTEWGQNWGIPVYNWDHMESNGYTWWKNRVRRVTRFFKMFRLDHILGFYRIYAFPWHPRRNQEFIGKSRQEAEELTDGLLPRWFACPDDSDSNKQSNRARGDRRLRAILEAAPDAEIIAEDLGWVPDYVRPHLGELGICGYCIPHWDCNEYGRPTPGKEFPEASFASYSTHDHDPLCGIWRGCLETIRRHAETPDGFPEWELHSARNTLRILSEFAGIPVPRDDRWPAYGKTIQLCLLKALLNSNARYAAIIINELFSHNERINEPGVSSQRNWSYRLPWTTGDLKASAEFMELTRLLRTAIQIADRVPRKKAAGPP